MTSLQKHNAGVAADEAGTAGDKEVGHGLDQAWRLVSSSTQPATGVP